MERMHTPIWQPVILYSLVMLLMSGGGMALGGADDTPRRGGTLRVGTTAEPATLDMHWQPEGTAILIALHYGEGLYTRGLDYGYIPMLAEGHTVSDDGLVYTIRLRRGVPFHHGKELTAADAAASLRRYGRLSVRGKQFFQRVDCVKALDHYTMQLRLHGKTALVLPLLGEAVIYPQEVLEEAGEGQVRTHIGTGPFKLAELQPGRIKLVRFEGYQSRPEPPNGYGGGKTAWLDTLLFLSIPDDHARMAALESGDVDITRGVRDAYERLKAHPDLKVQIVKPGYKFVTLLNKKKGLFTNVKVRQAALAALDMDLILRAALGDPQFYRLDSSLSFQEEPWWTDAGGELYNQKDLERARRLLKEAGYQGEPLRYMAVQDSDRRLLALAMKQQLEGVGFTVEVQPMEWSTLWRRRTNPDLWDAHTIYWWPGLDPTLQWAFRCDEPGWNCDPDFAKLLQAMETELQFERRYRLWQDIHWLFWDRVPFIQHGDMFWLTVMRKHVQGPFDMRQWYFWNVWLDK